MKRYSRRRRAGAHPTILRARGHYSRRTGVDPIYPARSGESDAESEMNDEYDSAMSRYDENKWKRQQGFGSPRMREPVEPIKRQDYGERVRAGRREGMREGLRGRFGPPPNKPSYGELFRDRGGAAR